VGGDDGAEPDWPSNAWSGVQEHWRPGAAIIHDASANHNGQTLPNRPSFDAKVISGATGLVTVSTEVEDLLTRFFDRGFDVWLHIQYSDVGLNQRTETAIRFIWPPYENLFEVFRVEFFDLDDDWNPKAEPFAWSGSD
jgi:hypothetical protein